MKSLAYLLSAVLLGAITIVIAFSGNKSAAANSQIIVSRVQQQESPNMVDGSKNPELIPDRIAYALLLRLIANRRTEQDKGAIRAYIRQMGLGKPSCNQSAALGTSEGDVETLIAAAEQFQQQVSPLDQQVKELRDKKRLDPNLEIKAQLKRLQQQKENIVAETVASLQKSLSEKGVEKLREHLNGQVKRKVKYTPAAE